MDANDDDDDSPDAWPMIGLACAVVSVLVVVQDCVWS